MERKQLDRAWNNARGGRQTPFLDSPIAEWRRIDMSPVREAITARILHQQTLPTYSEYYPGCLFPPPLVPTRWERFCRTLADLFCVHSAI